MSKLFFRYGAVSSAKTLNLLAAAYNYEVQGKRVLVVKPALDDRFGRGQVVSRAGLNRQADIILEKEDVMDSTCLDNVHCVLVDECQFLTIKQVDVLRDIATLHQIPVLAYGLRTDFRSNLFPGAQRLLEVADSIQEIKTTCWYCNKKAIYNLKIVNGKPTIQGPAVELGCEERYLPVCSIHYHEKTQALTT